jgi:RNA polymerase sigma factor (sigma-70 family)
VARVPAPSSELSDIELVDNVLQGAPGAIDAFYHRHSRLIYHCIRSRTGGQDVDDIFQAFFERLLKSGFRPLQLWQRGSSLPVYLSSVIRNFVTDFHRARRLREEAVGGTMELEPLSGAEAETITATTHLKELRHIGIRAWAVLEARDRRLVCDRLHRDLDNETIARRLELSVGALRTAMSRAQSRYLAHVRQLAPEFFPDRA